MNEFISKRNQKEIKTLVKNFKKEHRRIEVKFFDKMSGITSCRENSLLVDNLIKDLYRILEQGFNNLSKKLKIPLEISPLVLDIFKDAHKKYGSRSWSSMVVKRMEDNCKINFREKGYPDELIDREKEEKGYEI